MKKLIALVLAFIMALTLAACAANTEPAQTEQPEQTEQPAAAAENDAPAGVPEKLKLGLCNINEKGSSAVSSSGALKRPARSAAGNSSMRTTTATAPPASPTRRSWFRRALTLSSI